MPEPAITPHALWSGALWPTELPGPQAGFTMQWPARASVQDVMSGPSRLNLTARTSPPSWRFTVFFTSAQMERFESWYRSLLENSGGEFYARWIGGGRITAFANPYTYQALGKGWQLQGALVRTRIDHTICDAFINSVFGAILRDDGVSADIVLDDGAAIDIISGNYPLEMIAANEC